MYHSELTEHLNELGESSGPDEALVDIAHNDTEPVMRRVAAILVAVNLSVPVGHALAAMATQTIYDLTVADEDRYHGYPWNSHTGQYLKRLMMLTREQVHAYAVDKTRGVGQRYAANLILMADSQVLQPNPDADVVLKMTSGRDQEWWYEQVQQLRSG